jgi:hypothetical protein
VTICTTDKNGTIRSQRLYQVLFDSGLNVSMIKRSALPKGVITKLLGDTLLLRTLTSCLKTQEVVTMQDIRLPEFYKNRCINQQTVLVFDNDNVKYDIILGTNFLSKTGMKLNYSEDTSTQDSQWDSNALQTLLNKLWKMYCQTSKMPTFTLMMLVLSQMIGTTMSIC